jgi:hypothetical protein
MVVSKLKNLKYSPAVPFTYTENGAITYKTTGSAVLDLFSRGAAMRMGGRSSERDITGIFRPAFQENAALAMATLFYIRDIPRKGKGGQGERNFFRLAFTWVANNYPELAKELLKFIPEYGTWKDVLYATRGTPVYENALSLMGYQLAVDALALSEGKTNISLAAKWSPNESSGKLSQKMAVELATHLGLSMKGYRNLTSPLRKHLKLVETAMSSGNWHEIDYEKVPSRAMKMYRKAFYKRDESRFSAYIAAAVMGAKKINSTTLYPYEIIKDLIPYGRPMAYGSSTDEKALEAMWNALPNYLEGQALNALVVVDVSGSMAGDPMYVSTSLGLYVAERNEHPLWKNHFITFSAEPKLQKITGKSFKDRVSSLFKNAGYNTNLQAVFDLILDKAKSAKLSQSDLPETVYIVSDMEFDQIEDGYGGYGWYSSSSAASKKAKTNLSAIRAKFKKAGYEMPKIVFWNVRAANMQSPATFNEDGVAMFSGLSPTIFQAALTGNFDPLSAMLETIASERYRPIIDTTVSSL